jgi:acetyl esterase/lipase
MGFTRDEDVVYGHKDGMALVMDVYHPSCDANGAGVIELVSGGYFSDLVLSRESLPKASDIEGLLAAGFTVFAVGHSSSPKYHVDEILPDVSRAARFIRHHNDRFGVGRKIGIKGISSGGLLSLMAATNPAMADSSATDPVDRVPSDLQAVAVYSSPTDLLNVTKPGLDFLEFFEASGQPVIPAFDFHTWRDEALRFERISERQHYMQVTKTISPMEYASESAPPTLLLHNRHDPIVPFEQAEAFTSRLDELAVPTRLIAVEGEDHVWELPSEQVDEVVGWFSDYLL